MYHSFIDWFDYVWAKSAPRILHINSIISPSTASGAALFLTWEGYHVFGIPRRFVVDGSEYIRFYGIGGKRKDPNETFEACAIREGTEEIGNVIDGLYDSEHTEFYRSNGTIEKITLECDTVIPRLIYEKSEHTGHGFMKKDQDLYYMVGYNAHLRAKPEPNGELAAVLLLSDRHLSLISRRNDYTIGQILDVGGKIFEQNGIIINRKKILVPDGTASYLVRRV